MVVSKNNYVELLSAYLTGKRAAASALGKAWSADTTEEQMRALLLALTFASQRKQTPECEKLLRWVERQLPQMEMPESLREKRQELAAAVAVCRRKRGKPVTIEDDWTNASALQEALQAT